MAKKQTFTDKLSKKKGAGAAHCPVCDEILHPVRVREFVTIGGRRNQTSKMVKVCKCNQTEVYG
ncbi:MAG: hypothetical protein IPG71_11150 [bacterium]|nr:hypothetical protein [bacterium]